MLGKANPSYNIITNYKNISALNKQCDLIKYLLHTHNENRWSNFLGIIENSAEELPKLYKLNLRFHWEDLAKHPLKNNTGDILPIYHSRKPPPQE